MQKQGHYCKVCGEYKANEKFSGKGHAAHICKTCAIFSLEQRAEMQTITRIASLPYRLNNEQKKWLQDRIHDRRPNVQTIAKEQYALRYTIDE